MLTQQEAWDIDAMPLGTAIISRQAIVLGLPMVSHAPQLAVGLLSSARIPAQIATIAFHKLEL